MSAVRSIPAAPSLSITLAWTSGSTKSTRAQRARSGVRARGVPVFVVCSTPVHSCRRDQVRSDWHWGPNYEPHLAVRGHHFKSAIKRDIVCDLTPAAPAYHADTRAATETERLTTAVACDRLRHAVGRAERRVRQQVRQQQADRHHPDQVHDHPAGFLRLGSPKRHDDQQAKPASTAYPGSVASDPRSAMPI